MGSFISKDEFGPNDWAKGIEEDKKKHSLKGERAYGSQNPEWKHINRRKAAEGEGSRAEEEGSRAENREEAKWREEG